MCLPYTKCLDRHGLRVLTHDFRMFRMFEMFSMIKVRDRFAKGPVSVLQALNVRLIQQQLQGRQRCAQIRDRKSVV